jgi:CDP-glycerol glycerophosphotransferase (TagB/SpsB family)
VSKYAKIGYVSYFGAMSMDEVYAECTPLDFLRDVSHFFTQNEMDDVFIKNRYATLECLTTKISLTGFPRYDDVVQYINCTADIWNKNISDAFRVIWTPRWTTNEGNCHFFDYKDLFIEFCDQNKKVDFVFRPHPQAFQEWETTGELPEKEAKKYIEQYEVRENMHLDASPNYYPLLYSSNCLVTDKSTMILDYFMTKNPVVFCKRNYELDGIYAELEPGLYITENWEETAKILNQLQQGIDPLREKREELITKCFYTPKEGAGYLIKETIKRDALK